MPLKIAIIYLSYHCDSYLEKAVEGLQKTDYPKNAIGFIIVDHPHREKGSSVNFIKEKIKTIENLGLAEIIILAQEKNAGFAAGNNVGIKWALENKYDYIFLHNQDGYLSPEAVGVLVETMQGDPTIGVVQPLILLHPETDYINTSGNCLHYLGFGYCGDYRMNKKGIQPVCITDIGYASGAAVMLRADLLRAHGLWDEDYFLYHEDLEYSYRLKVVGYRVVVHHKALFYHQYEFNRNQAKYYLMERNRFAFILTYYKLPTILLLAPIAVLVEFGLLIYSLLNGWLIYKIKSYSYWLSLTNLRLWLKKRHQIQKMRIISDRGLFVNAVSKINFADSAFNSPLIRYLLNPIFSAYWFIVKRLIFW